MQGIGGKTLVSGCGTIKVRITDDAGRKHNVNINDVLYVLESPTNLISPQQWSSDTDEPSGTGEVTISGSTLLFWEQKKYSKFVPHHPQMKIPIITVNDGYTTSTAFKATMQPEQEVPCYFQTSTVVEDEQKQAHIIPIEDDESVIESILDSECNNIEIDNRNRLYSEPTFSLIDNESTDGDMDKSSMSSIDEESELGDNEEYVEVPENELDTIAKAMSMGLSKQQKELLHIHIKLKHLPFSYLKKLAQEGVIPKYLAKVEPPLCTSCLMGKQHRKPWRGRGKDKKSI